MSHTSGRTDPPDPPVGTAAALSFAGVADAYDRSRPGYPDEAARWLVGTEPRQVLELGAGTGKLTASLAALGHDVVATDPLEPMLRLLQRDLPDVPTVVASAERIPLPARSVDVVVAGQAFHWFDLGRALPEIARVLRPGGRLAVVWNLRDERIPWVRRLEELIGNRLRTTDPTQELIGSQLFGYVEQAGFRFWQPTNRARLRDLAVSGSRLAVMPESARDRVLAQVEELYAEYGRGHDGMLMPYLTRCYAATVRAPAVEDEPARERRGARAPGTRASDPPSEPPTEDGDGSLLIDFT